MDVDLDDFREWHGEIGRELVQVVCAHCQTRTVASVYEAADGVVLVGAYWTHPTTRHPSTGGSWGAVNAARKEAPVQGTLALRSALAENGEHGDKMAEVDCPKHGRLNVPIPKLLNAASRFRGRPRRVGAQRQKS